MSTQDIITVLTPIASILVSGGISLWIYKTLSWKVKEQSNTIVRLEREVEKLKGSENIIRQKYIKVISLILRNKNCSDGRECSIFKKYVDLLDQEGAI